MVYKRKERWRVAKRASVAGGYRHYTTQRLYFAGYPTHHFKRQRYIIATKSRRRKVICTSMVGRARYHGVQNCTIITPSPPSPPFSATLLCSSVSLFPSHPGLQQRVPSMTLFPSRPCSVPSFPHRRHTLDTRPRIAIPGMTHDNKQEHKAKTKSRTKGK